MGERGAGLPAPASAPTKKSGSALLTGCGCVSEGSLINVTYCEVHGGTDGR